MRSTAMVPRVENFKFPTSAMLGTRPRSSDISKPTIDGQPLLSGPKSRIAILSVEHLCCIRERSSSFHRSIVYHPQAIAYPVLDHRSAESILGTIAITHALEMESHILRIMPNAAYVGGIAIHPPALLQLCGPAQTSALLRRNRQMMVCHSAAAPSTRSKK